MAVCIAPSAASAGELYLMGYPGSYHVNYEAAPGERNVVSASALLGHVVNLYDEGATITTPSKPSTDGLMPGYTRYPCELIDAHHGRCYIPALLYGATDLQAELEDVVVHLGDGNDTYSTIENTDPFAPEIFGEAGDDRLYLLGKPSPYLVGDAGDGSNYIRAAATSDPNNRNIWGNALIGGDGPDEIFALNGTYNGIRCFGGDDHVVADKIDSVDPDCENVERR
jgi:hypothetical protein